MHQTCEIALVLALFYCLTLVVLLLAACYADDKFRKTAVVDEQAQLPRWNSRRRCLLHG